MDVYCRSDELGTHEWRLDSVGAGDDPRLRGLLASYRTASFASAGTERPTFLLRQAVASPLSSTLDLARAVQLYVYQPRDMVEILEFDRRITQRYSTYWAGHGEYYGGTFHCDAFGPQWLVEVAAFGADDADSADRLVADVKPPADVAEIIAECKALQDRDQPRYVVWLLPREPQR